MNRKSQNCQSGTYQNFEAYHAQSRNTNRNQRAKKKVEQKNLILGSFLTVQDVYRYSQTTP